jgi:hypothetical protein
MYRVRSLLKVNRDGWNGAIENIARVNEIAKRRGWQQATAWTQTFGPFNENVIELEYPDLATYERETAAFLRGQEGHEDRHRRIPVAAQRRGRPQRDLVSASTSNPQVEQT